MRTKAEIKNVFVLPSTQEFRQVDEPWFQLLLKSQKIQGEKGVYGRNNVIFTLSLAYFSSGYEVEACELTMLEFNDRLANPLSDRELTRIIRSAYSGKYQAAHREKLSYYAKSGSMPIFLKSSYSIKTGLVEIQERKSCSQVFT